MNMSVKACKRLHVSLQSALSAGFRLTCAACTDAILMVRRVWRYVLVYCSSHACPHALPQQVREGWRKDAQQLERMGY